MIKLIQKGQIQALIKSIVVADSTTLYVDIGQLIVQEVILRIIKVRVLVLG
jgi:hypothetical protein